VKLVEVAASGCVGDGEREAARLIEDRVLKVATPATAASVLVPARVPVPVARAMVMLEVSVVTTLPY